MAVQQDDDVLVRIAASPARRILGITVLGALGGLLIYGGLIQPSGMVGLQITLIAAGVGVLALTEKMRRESVAGIELTQTELRSTDGHVLARLNQIERVNRGAFAFKPSNGFVLVMRDAGPRHWAPGLWWRIGRQVGVGGVTQASQTRFMAEMIQTILTQAQMERDAASGGT
jgi:hypothetical protein